MHRWRFVGQRLELILYEAERPDRMAGRGGRVTRLDREIDQVDALVVGDAGGVLAQELERQLVVPSRLVRSGDRHRLVARVDTGEHGGGQVVSSTGMASQL